MNADDSGNATDIDPDNDEDADVDDDVIILLP